MIEKRESFFELLESLRTGMSWNAVGLLNGSPSMLMRVLRSESIAAA